MAEQQASEAKRLLSAAEQAASKAKLENEELTYKKRLNHEIHEIHEKNQDLILKHIYTEKVNFIKRLTTRFFSCCFVFFVVNAVFRIKETSGRV